MNHLLKEVPNEQGTQMRSYGDPTLPVAPNLVKEIVAFIQNTQR